jgi:hypothetical protein
MARPNAICPHCGQPVLRAITAAGRRQLLNPEPDPAGNVAASRDGTYTWRARVPNAEMTILSYERLYMPHAATCKNWPPRTSQVKVVPAPTRSGPIPSNVVFLGEYRRTRRPQ